MQNQHYDKSNANLEANINIEERPMSLADAAIYLNISKSFLYKLTCKNLITYFKPNNKKIYFLKSDLNNYLLRNKKKSQTELEQEAINYVLDRGIE